ncbi:MAG: C25 family cysteine peptidase, partial [Bacteroidota bacterium]
MKRYHATFFLILSLLPFSLLAQSFDYGNDWYTSNPDRTYIKLVVREDGVYRVTSQDLQSAGYDLSAVNPVTLKLYYRGQEVPIYISKVADGLGYVEFFGERNNGQLDSIMYRDPYTGVHVPDLQPNKNISLFSDEAAYFLTWDNNASGNRYFSNLDPTYSLFTPEQFFRYEAYKEFHPDSTDSEYVRGGGGQFDSFLSLNSDYVTGEGYLSGRNFGDFSYLNPRTISLPTPAPANTGNPATVRTRVFGRSQQQHALRIFFNGESNTPVLDTTHNRVYIRTYTRDYQPGSAMNDNTDLTFNALNTTDNNNVAWLSIEYDRQPDLANQQFIRISDWDKSGKAYLRLNNTDGNDTLYVYDRQNRFRNVGLITGGTGNVIVQGFPNTRDLWLATDKSIKTPEIRDNSFNKLYDAAQGAEYVIITHPELSASAVNFAGYRDTASANPLSARVVYTNEIYDEFGYGTLTPWAIKRFCKYALDNWTVKPRYFMLWGKGKYEVRGFDNLPIVPTYGYPATDYEFVSHFDQNSTVVRPEAAIGRLNILTNEEGFNFQKKVDDYEHTPWQPWMKKGAFLGGGGTEGEQNSIGGAFDYMINVFEGIPFGGSPIYFQKKSSSTVEDPTTASYHDGISEGVSLLHFFGHSTSNIQDISIREPFEYNNFSRYPLMIAMGCYGGDFTVDGASFGERWVKQPDRGSIGYLANSSAGYLNPLRDYSRILYQAMHRDDLGIPVGDMIRNVLTSYTDSLIGIQYRNHGRQMNLQGDPAVTLYHPTKPDLEINETSIFFTPENFTSQDDSFRINIIVNNYGLVEEDSFRMTIRQRLPDGTLYTEHPTLDLPLIPYRDTVSVLLSNPVGNGMTGQNTFEVFVDANDSIDEYFENNNFVNLNRVVPGNIPAILNPPEFAIVGENRVSLQASAFFMTRDEDVNYIFEIDTTAAFNSPLRANSGQITGNATFVSWEVPFTLVDSTVYFWRVRLASVKPSVWGTSSFRYLPNQNGWAQAKLQQFLKDDTRSVSIDQIQQEWKFGNFGVEFEFSTRKGGSFNYSINGSLIADLAANGFTSNGVGFVIIDGITLETEYSENAFGPLGTAAAPQDLYKLKTAILNANDGDYFIVGSNRNPRIPTWGEDIFDALQLIGVSDNIRYIPDGEAFILIGRKGYPNSATEIYAPTAGDKYALNNILLTSFERGQVSSTRIGPATTWDQMVWDWKSQDDLVQEDAKVNIMGIRPNGSDSLIFANLNRGTYNLASIDPVRFPYLRLDATLEDTVTRTAPQLDNWHVFFTPAPDAVVDPLTNFVFNSDTLFEGQDVFLHMGARNISKYNMDSLDVRITVERADRSREVLDSMKIAPLLSNGEPVEFEYGFNTLGKELDRDVLLIVEVNPANTPAETHQFNNVYVQPFHVIVDRINPIMDITFDGKHIIDGDYVSPRPEILIEVNDENGYIALEDSNSVELYWRRGTTAATPWERIFFSSPKVDFIPGTLPENKARLYFWPGRDYWLPDGDYSLRVQGRDQKGNAAGKGENFYEVTFQVEQKSTITEVLNYPNPFSTSTRFVYTLTGIELPEVFQIHIYTISGKMIKTIDLLELGDVKVGRNITEYAWDGTDDNGDYLANGVYL